jgi:hypothetical protein
VIEVQSLTGSWAGVARPRRPARRGSLILAGIIVVMVVIDESLDGNQSLLVGWIPNFSQEQKKGDIGITVLGNEIPGYIRSGGCPNLSEHRPPLSLCCQYIFSRDHLLFSLLYFTLPLTHSVYCHLSHIVLITFQFPALTTYLLTYYNKQCLTTKG